MGVESLFPHISYEKPAPIAGKYPKSKPSGYSPSKATKLAYVILVHEKVAQTIRLLEAIYHPDNWYVIHVDVKSPDLKEDLVIYANRFHNMYPSLRAFLTSFANSFLPLMLIALCWKTRSISDGEHQR